MDPDIQISYKFHVSRRIILLIVFSNCWHVIVGCGQNLLSSDLSGVLLDAWQALKGATLFSLKIIFVFNLCVFVCIYMSVLCTTCMWAPMEDRGYQTL